MGWPDARRLVELDTRSALFGLGDPAAALDLFRAAYELRVPEARRSRFNDLAHLLAAQVSVGAWPDATASLDRLTAEVDGIRSGRTDALLRRLDRRIGDRRPRGTFGGHRRRRAPHSTAGPGALTGGRPMSTW